MIALGVILLIAASVVIGWVYYFFTKVAIAIWFPEKANKQWLAITETSGIQFSYFFFKWIAPRWVLSSTVLTIVKLTHYIPI